MFMGNSDSRNSVLFFFFFSVNTFLLFPSAGIVEKGSKKEKFSVNVKKKKMERVRGTKLDMIIF